MTSLQIATWIVGAARIYLAVGLAFAIVCSAWLLPRLNPSARGGSWAFRLVVLPGLSLLWPMLLLRILRGTPQPIERTSHRLPVLQSSCRGVRS